MLRRRLRRFKRDMSQGSKRRLVFECLSGRSFKAQSADYGKRTRKAAQHRRARPAGRTENAHQTLGSCPMAMLRVAANPPIIAALLGLLGLIFTPRGGGGWQGSQLRLLWRVVLLLKTLRLVRPVWQSDVVLHILAPCVTRVKGIRTACAKTSVWTRTAWVRRERPVSTAASLVSAPRARLAEEAWRLGRPPAASAEAFWSLPSTDLYWSVIVLKAAGEGAARADRASPRRRSIMPRKATGDYSYSQHKSFPTHIVARLNAWGTPDRSKCHLGETYGDTGVLPRSTIGAFFVPKVLLTPKNRFRLANEPADTTLTPQTGAVGSSGGGFERHRGS